MDIDINDEYKPKELRISFVGRGEVKGFLFEQVEKSNKAYIYEVSDTFGHKWHEVFTRREDARFGKIAYPKSNSFGLWVWSARTIEKAQLRFNLISN